MPQPTLHSTLIDYPDSDGCPMPEGGFQFNSLTYAVLALRVYFQHRNDVYVAGNMFIYDEEDNSKSSVAPDVFVVFGVSNHTRDSYFLWQERKGPDFVMEIASRSTFARDRVEKPGRYAALGVREYWQYDPRGELLTPPLQGFRLEGGAYVPLPASTLADGTIGVYSPVLGLHARMEGEMLRFHDPVTGHDLRTTQEAEDRLREVEDRLREEAHARQQAEMRLAELEARLRTLQRPSSAGNLPDDREASC